MSKRNRNNEQTPDLIRARDERTIRRKKFKRKVDRAFNLAMKDDERIILNGNSSIKLSNRKARLLDEGAVVGDEAIQFIIRKGTLEKYLNGKNEYLPNLTDSFVGNVNLGHMDFAIFPYVIGTFKKSDLSLTDIGNGRQGLNVNLHLDDSSIFIQELKRQPYDIGISSEFYYHIDREATEKVDELVIDEVYIFAFGLVGECGNVNSSGLELKGDFEVQDEMQFDTQDEARKNPEDIEDIEDIEEDIDDVDDVDEEPDESADDDETGDETDGDEDTGDTEGTEDTEDSDDSDDSDDADGDDSDDDDSDDDSADTDSDEETGGEEADIESIVEAALTELRNDNIKLKAENEALKKKNKRLQKKIASSKEREERIIAQFPHLFERMDAADRSKKPENDRSNKSDIVASYIYGDGIGE